MTRPLEFAFLSIRHGSVPCRRALRMSDSRPTPDPNDPPAAGAATAAADDDILGRPTPKGKALEKIPRSFGRYRIQDCLGRGGMGAVFRAHDAQLDRIVALKIPFLGKDDVDTTTRFYREARAAATLQHANI